MAHHKRSQSLDLDRALPPLPSANSTQSSSGAESISSPFIDAMNSRLLDCTTWSTPFVDKHTFARLTQDLMVPPTPTLSFLEREAYNCVDPVKHNSSESSKSSTNMFDQNSSTHNLISFRDNDRYTRLQDIYDAQEKEVVVPAARNMYEVAATKSYGKPHGLPQSCSDSNMRYNNEQSHVFSPQSESAKCTEPYPYLRFADENDPPLVSSSPRGRAWNRTPSPTKQLADIKEESPASPCDPPKRSRSPVKQLFGEKGWLGRSTSMKELPSEEYRKTGFKFWGGKLKQRMIEKKEDLSKTIPAALNIHTSPSKPPKVPQTTKFPVSLEPPEQSKLYSEIELMICATANKFLIVEKESGRMSYDSVEKITQFWTSKNRPQVLEFHFDQATQRDLVEYNVKTFRFYGPSAENPVAMHSMLLAWKTLAKEMSVRTFCSPDSMIKKQLHDSYTVLEMLGAPGVTFLAFQEIQMDALRKMHERQTLRKEYDSKKFGVERQWEPPGGWSPKHNGEEWQNPFE